MKFFQEMHLLWKIININFKSALTLRTSFLLRLIFMMVNNLIFFICWYVFFNKFKIVNGWNIQHISLMYGLMNFSLGINACCLHGLRSMVLLIENCDLDILLVRPGSVLWGISSYRTEHSGLGSIFSGVILISLSGFTSIHDLGIIFLFVLCAVSVIAAINIGFGSLAFWFSDMNRLSQDLFNIVVMLSTNPSCVYKGVLKFITFTFIPVGFVSYLPIRYFIDRDYIIILYVVMSSIVFLVLSVLIFHSGLRRYESGNYATSLSRF